MIIKKKHVWPALVVLILGSFVTFTVMAARIASSDPNFAIEPDYYRKAVTWDSTLAENHRTAALGWTMETTLGRIDAGRIAVLTLDLRDSLGAPVTGAHIGVEARLVAHADNVVLLNLADKSDGRYSAPVPFAQPGLTELRIVATRGSDRFSTNVRLDASETSVARIELARPGDPMAARAKAGSRREHGLAETPRAE